MNEYCVILTTASSEKEAENLAFALVNNQLASCVNILHGIRSIYRWKGEMCDDKEYLLLIKSKINLFPLIKDKILALHSYETPEIIAIPVEAGFEDYLKWIDDNTVKISQ